jgi:predicted PurR-regulated permease PerM
MRWISMRAILQSGHSAEGDSGKPDPASAASLDNSEKIPLPRRDPNTLLLGGILALLALYAIYFAADILLTVSFAFILQLLLQPAMRALCRLRLPRTLAALMVIVALFTVLAALASTLSHPAAEWIARAPDSLPRLEQRLSIIREPLDWMQNAAKEVEKIAAGPPDAGAVVAVKGPGLSAFLFTSTRAFLVHLGTTLVLTFFLLVSNGIFLRRLVEILPRLSDKKQAVDIFHEIERSISGYLVTISLMNAAVGVATGIATYLCGLADPILWGTLAFLLNYVLILGPLTGVTVLFVAGLLTFDTLWQAMLPAAIYLAIHIVEGESITPLLLARRFTLNPVLIVLSLVFWYWMWGVAGMLLAVPMLATFKIVCDRIGPLTTLGHFLGGEAHGKALGHPF